MNLDQAYQTLELSKNASEDEVKKQYKKLAAKYHPDVNKDENASDKFKSINAAYELISNPKHDHDDFDISFNPGQWFSQIHHTKYSNKPPLKIPTSLTFAESVLGCKKTFKVNKFVKCDPCNGQGSIPSNEKCHTCSGQKQRVRRMQNMVMVETCSDCSGTGNQPNPCKDCNQAGSVEAERSIEVKIHGGVHDGQKILLRGGGHFNSHGPFGGSVGEAIIEVAVEKQFNMTLEENNVLSELNLTLLEALEGTVKEVSTVKGPTTLKVPKMSKNGNVVVLTGYGVPDHGAHLFTLNVSYPEPTQDFINAVRQLNKGT